MKKKKLRLVKSAVVSSSLLVELIELSHKNSAFAECATQFSSGGDITISCQEIIDDPICLLENSVDNTLSFSIEAVESDSWPVAFSFEELDTIDISTGLPIPYILSDITYSTPSPFNGYPLVAPTDNPMNIDVTFSVGEVGLTNNGNVELNYRTILSTDYYFSPDWSGYPYEFPVERTIVVDHVNHTPEIIDYTTDPVAFELPVAQSTVDIDVSVTINDFEGDDVLVTFELSETPDFTEILQTASISTYGDPGIDYVVSHTFTAVSEGIYYWRATIVEESVEPSCNGMINQFDPPIIPVTMDEVMIDLTKEPYVEGIVYVDDNKNCQQDPEEPVLSNVRLRLTDEFSNSAETTTDSEGHFGVAGLTGSLTIEMIEIPEGYTINDGDQYVCGFNENVESAVGVINLGVVPMPIENVETVLTLPVTGPNLMLPMMLIILPLLYLTVTSKKIRKMFTFKRR
ncbi:hypothetical protein H6762_03775 [Candidatus Nomurabacteria bacterium]|uniref:SD-repeat containing protein B domain-containing protein n=1 Tax=Candidatus Dojkabacteria bacterium TaxID=2099670 RepID=A0A955KWV8_9BACT|nr:hypothetical protein [Candidatus Dojkabacteria bacterium]MCB9790079.1 hypothetical protein [Candidatus Nomurabacteria bacterium]